MGAYTSSIGRELAAKEREVDSFVNRTLKAGYKVFRQRFTVERLSGPPGIFSGVQFGTTGMTRQSQQGNVHGTPGGFELEASIGGHADVYEAQGKLQFAAIFTEEAGQMLDALGPGLQSILGVPGQPVAIAGISAAEAGIGPMDLATDFGRNRKAYDTARAKRIGLRKQMQKAGRKLGLRKAALKEYIRRKVGRAQAAITRREQLRTG